ncbi:hypothetical protein V8C43DRAFT_275259 [Trichoderma afarasin]
MRPLVRCLSFGERRALVLFVLRGGANSSCAEPGWANGRCEGRCIYGYARPTGTTNDQRPTRDGKTQPRIGKRKLRSGFVPFAHVVCLEL